MEWAKSRPRSEFDLAGSNLLPLTVDELPGARDALEFTGPNEDGYEPLLEAIARHYSVTSDHVALATGASGANFLTFAAVLQPGDDVLVERPGYDPLIAAVRVVGANVLRFDRCFEDRYRLDPGRIASALTPRTRLIVLTNPHNPTGAVADSVWLDEVGRLAARAGARVLVDEVYLDTVEETRRTPAALRSDVFISTSSLTKAYGLNAIRCGWTIAPPDVIQEIRRMRGIVDGIGAAPLERLAALAFSRIDRLAERARAIVESNRQLVIAVVDGRADLEWVRPEAGSLAFPRIRGVEDAAPFIQTLLSKYGTAVVPGHFFEAPAHFRIAFAGRRENVTGGLEAIGRALGERQKVEGRRQNEE